jgi:hypothetical protein
MHILLRVCLFQPTSELQLQKSFPRRKLLRRRLGRLMFSFEIVDVQKSLLLGAGYIVTCWLS